MAHATNTLDALADGQFQPKLADPADTLTKRGGKGYVIFEGATYTRLAWIRRSARLGHTLAAGEGAVLDAELERVTAMVESAYREGYGDGISENTQDDGYPTLDEEWKASDAYWVLHGDDA